MLLAALAGLLGCFSLRFFSTVRRCPCCAAALLRGCPAAWLVVGVAMAAATTRCSSAFAPCLLLCLLGCWAVFRAPTDVVFTTGIHRRNSRKNPDYCHINLKPSEISSSQSNSIKNCDNGPCYPDRTPRRSDRQRAIPSEMARQQRNEFIEWSGT